MSAKTLLSVEEFAQLQLSDTEDFELVEGELIPLSSGNPMHADIRGLLEYLLRIYFGSNPIGKVLAEVDCRVSPGTVRRPDVSVFLADRWQSIDRKKISIPFAPDIAVEVLSSSEVAVDVHRKALEYLAAGAQEVWQLDQENGEIFIQTNSGIRLLRGEDVLTTPLLPNFSAPVSQLLAGF